MLYTQESHGSRYADYAGRAHAERAKAISAMLAGAPTGFANVAVTVGRGLKRVGRSIVSGVVTAQRRAAAMRQLRALDDRMLKDIGISRGQIPYLVDQQLSAERPAPAGSGKGCDITAFPDRQAAAASARVLLRPAA
jgi:uncharacterized protein YjiS (DUF1127 family)